MATKGEVRRGVEKYLRSKFSDYNNSVGQFDRVIMGVLSIMGSTLLQPDDPKFDHHIGLETERMLKKYGPGTDYYNERFGKKGKNKDSAMEYDPIMCMMVPKKANDSLRMPRNLFDKQANVIPGKENEFLTKVKAECAKISNLKDLDDLVDEIANYGYPYDLEKDIDNVIKLQKSRIQKNGAKDQRTVDFSSSDAKKVFEYIDKHVDSEIDKFMNKIFNAKTTSECEKIENEIRKAQSSAVEEYIQIWNMVGLYAQKSKNRVVEDYNKLMSEAFKKYNSLSGK